MSVKLYDHQKRALEEMTSFNNVAFYHDMGLGKTFTGAEKLIELNEKVNLVICQKSKIDDWIDHFGKFYNINRYDLTKKYGYENFLFDQMFRQECIGFINYELAFRRPELAKLKDFTLMLDESSLIQNEKAKQSKFILNKLKPKNVILLSGTPTDGKYERLWSQMKLLGWNITKKQFYNQYVEYHYEDIGIGFPIMKIDGYKNVDRLKNKMRAFGCHFLKTDEVMSLPAQNDIEIKIKPTKEYKKFIKNSLVNLNGLELVGDTSLTKLLYSRMLCGHLNKNKIQAFEDVLSSTNDRLIVFYNFNNELKAIEDICLKHDRPMSIVSGQEKDLNFYEQYENSVTAIQYQAGSMGLNLQKANKIVYFTPTQKSEYFEQSKKRTHRIGQEKPCFYYMLITEDTVEEDIYRALKERKDYTDYLFKE